MCFAFFELSDQHFKENTILTFFKYFRFLLNQPPRDLNLNELLKNEANNNVHL